MSAIRLREISHGYLEGERYHSVLDALNADIEESEITALVGQSGSGKSTLLNLIGGLEPAQKGQIEIFNQSVSKMDDRQRTLFRRQTIGIIYQSFNLIPTLTVAENIALPLALNKTPLHERLNRVSQMLEAIGLPDRAEQYPDRLSGGEQQRVAIARATVHAPPLILADEPTGNLDATTGRRCLQLLTDLVREQGCTLLLVTHSREVARSADHLITLESGRLATVSPAPDVGHKNPGRENPGRENHGHENSGHNENFPGDDPAW